MESCSAVVYCEPMKKTFFALGVAVFLTVGIAACSGSKTNLVGTWGNPDAKAMPSLVFDQNGEVHGTDGCNLIGGEYKISGSTVTFTEFRSTMMYCEGVDTWLLGGTSAEIAKDSMTIFNKTGEEIGTLERQ